MSNLSKHLLRTTASIGDFIDTLCDDKLYRYKESVFDLCSKLQEGETYNIIDNLRAENRPFFIKCVCLYINQKKANCNVQFADDLTSIYGIVSINEWHRELKAYGEQVERMKQGTIYAHEEVE